MAVTSAGAGVVARRAAGAGTSRGAASDCTARQLTGAVESSSGAAGTIVLRIVLRNTGAGCTLAGYPLLRLRRGARAMPTRTVHGGLPLLEAAADPVELGPDGRAFLLVAYVDLPAGDAPRPDSQAISQCPEASAVDLWVAGWRRPVRVRALITACDGGRLRSSPFLHPAGTGDATTAAAPQAQPARPGDL